MVCALNGGCAKQIWFIEKCRVLENEKLALMELLDETKAQQAFTLRYSAV